MITQREYDIRQLESEQKIIGLFEEWKRAFLKGRLVEQQPLPEQQGIPQQPLPEQQGIPLEQEIRGR